MNLDCSNFTVVLPKIVDELQKGNFIETGAIEFLADNLFDFNKFARYGIPFLNKPQEETFSKCMKEKFISFDLSYSMIDRLIDIRKQIKEWMILLPVRDGCRHGENTFPYQSFAKMLNLCTLIFSISEIVLNQIFNINNIILNINNLFCCSDIDQTFICNFLTRFVQN
uniref:Uncharacterized protein n=1 Tax=Tetranychus urticae TaxID=32264 RepID=T1L5Y1_TETUR